MNETKIGTRIAIAFAAVIALSSLFSAVLCLKFSLYQSFGAMAVFLCCFVASVGIAIVAVKGLSANSNA